MSYSTSLSPNYKMKTCFEELMVRLKKQLTLYLTHSSYSINSISFFIITFVILACSCIFGHLEEVTPVLSSSKFSLYSTFKRLNDHPEDKMDKLY